MSDPYLAGPDRVSALFHLQGVPAHSACEDAASSGDAGIIDLTPVTQTAMQPEATVLDTDADGRGVSPRDPEEGIVASQAPEWFRLVQRPDRTQHGWGFYI